MSPSGNGMRELNLRSDYNIRSSRYFVAETVDTCGRCRASTGVVALALSPGHELLAMDADPEGEELAQELWEGAFCNALLFYIEHLSDAAQRRLKASSSGYRLAYCAATQGSYWANHCERCGSPLDDHDLFCEPEGAFLPTSHTRAAAIKLTRIDEPLEAAAAGYAQEPEFFASMEGSEEEWPFTS